MKVRYEVIREPHYKVSNVLDSGLDVTTAKGADADWLPLDQVIHDRKVVRRQVPKHVDVALKQSQVDANRIEVKQFAQLAALENFFHLADGAGVDEGVIHHQREFISISKFDQLFSFARGRR